jgi:type IV pilus assembly protein PilA
MKKMNKKGFTLIELLAIIVILAIIAVITVPIILNIIDEARKGAEKNSVIGYGKAVELAYTQYQYENSMNPGGTNSHVADESTDGKTVAIKIDGATTAINLKVDFDGDKVVCNGTNTITSGKVELKACSVNGTGTSYNYGEGKATPAS